VLHFSLNMDILIRWYIQKFPDWVDKEITTKINIRWGATQRVMAAKLTRLTHKVAIRLHLVAENFTICSSRSRRPVRKLLDTPSYTSPICQVVTLFEVWSVFVFTIYNQFRIVTNDLHLNFIIITRFENVISFYKQRMIHFPRNQSPQCKPFSSHFH
jgi:hypothetical protein